MDLTTSIWLSSVAGAFFFFGGGRLWGRAASTREALAAPVPEDPSARAVAEQETLSAREACADASRALGVERTRASGLHDQVSLAGQRLDELSSELARKQGENDVLRRQLEKLSNAVAEADALRKKVRDLETAARAPEQKAMTPSPAAARPNAGRGLSGAVEGRLDQLRLRRGSCQSAVLADTRGLLMASSGDTIHDEALAAAAAMLTEVGERTRGILPLGEPLEIRLMDVNRTVFTARWLRDAEETRLLGTLGVSRDRPDAHADALESSVSELLRDPSASPPGSPGTGASS
jgi:hypothetical protein